MTLRKIPQTCSAALTLLSPIHIGCGEEYEPTNFIADPKKQLLYFFEPSRVPLSDGERKRLGTIAKSGNIRDIYKFYEDRFSLYSAYASNLIPFDNDLRRKIEKLSSGELGQNGKRGENKLNIPRMAFGLKERKILPYIPGSSVKGAIHTALLDRLAVSYTGSLLNNRELDEKLLLGKMDKSPMKLISVADFLKADQSFSGTRIIKRANIKKSSAPNLSAGGVPSLAEVLIPACYREFVSEISLRQPVQGDGVHASAAYSEIRQIARDLNRFNLAQFESHVAYLRTGSKATIDWVNSVKKLLQELMPQLESGKAALIRLGMSTGAQNFTIRKPGVAKIRSKSSRDPVFMPTASTMALIDNSNFQGVLPFGWAILEINPEKENVLKDWCEKWSKVFPTSQKELWAELENLKSSVSKKQAKIQAEEEAIKRQAQLKEEAEAKERQKLQELPEHLRKLAELVKSIEAVAKVAPGSELSKNIVAYLSEAVNWPAEEQREIAASIGKYAKSKDLKAGNVGKTITKLLKQLRGE